MNIRLYLAVDFIAFCAQIHQNLGWILFLASTTGFHVFRIVKAFKYYILIAGKVRPPVLDIEPPFLSKISSLKLPPSVLMQMFPHRHIWCDLETLKQVSPGPQTHAISAGICFFKHRGTQQSDRKPCNLKTTEDRCVLIQQWEPGNMLTHTQSTFQDTTD